MFHNIINRFILLYLDDILQYSQNYIKHEEHLRSVPQWLVAATTMERGTEQKQAFEELKLLLYWAPVLALSDFSKPFELYIDASNLDIGGVFMQLGHLIVYFS